MTSVLAVPSAIDLLRRQLAAGPAELGNLALPLRALQLRGVPQLDLVVQIERIRATNDASTEDEQIEENCLLALDIVNGQVPRHGLSWDASSRSASLLARALSESAIASALSFALEPSDLLPPRARPEGMPPAVSSILAFAVNQAVESFALEPEKAELVRAPKSPFTSRPAAIMAFPDRLALEALMTPIEVALQTALPEAVVWPRNRATPGTGSFSNTVLEWGSEYIVKADIAHFYESVEHSLLAVFLATRLGANLLVARGIEAVLTATMGIERGLPQGPLASDIAASAYLLPIDQRLAETGQPYLRYADDFYFPADDIGHGRRIIQTIESWLTELGLSLNSDKTIVMRKETFAENLERPAVRQLKEEAANAHFASLESAEDQSEAQEVLDAVGLDEEFLWDLMYHHSVTVEDLVGNVVEDSGRSLPRAYQVFFEWVAANLLAGTHGDKLAPLASLARECLVILGPRSEFALRLPSLRIVQTWFPHLSPDVARYLIARANEHSVADYLRDQLGSRTEIDWVDAWMCHAAGRVPPEVAPIAELREALGASATGPLTRMEALRALTNLNATNESEWRATLSAASPAMSSEILFAGMAEFQSIPWLSRMAREADHPGIAAIAGALEPGDEQSR